ncbi:MAG: GerMN domain-containing protein [Clostridiaceae bacterium]|nr:GerMN domain-containing protein [Clostridiaceae bacterium]
MVRSLTTIILLIMIFITASGIPLYADTMHLDLLQNARVSTEDTIVLDSNITMLSPSHPQLEITLTSSSKALPIEFNETQPVTVFLYHDEDRVAPINLLDADPSFSRIEKNIISDESFSFVLDLPQKLLDVPNGNYELEVQLHIVNMENPVTSSRLPLSYNSEATYIQASNSIVGNKTALTLYFPDNNSSYLIPITRTIPYTNRPLRATQDHLLKGPHEALGLLEGASIPEIQGLGLSRGIAQVYFSDNIGVYGEYASSARMAVSSIVNSLSSIREVDGVQFYFNNKIVKEGFHGMIMDEPIYKDMNPKIFVGYITPKDRMLLLPLPANNENLSVTEIFKSLKFSNEFVNYSYTLQPSVPKDVELLDYTLEKGILSLQINSQFIETFYDDYNRGAFMVDSLLYTFSSLDDVDSIEFHIENPPSTLPDGVILNKPIVPANYINPETY